MPTAADFRLGVLFSDVYKTLPTKQQSRAGSWPQKMVSMGFRVESSYCAHKDDINRRIAATAPNPKKVYYVSVANVKRVYPDLRNEVDAAIERLPVADDVSVCAEDTQHAQSDARSDASGPSDIQAERQEGAMREVCAIELREDERFVGSDGQAMCIRAYGERTKNGILFDKNDMYSAFGRTHRKDPSFLTAISVTVSNAIDTATPRHVIDMWQFVELVVHSRWQGSENAKLVYDWVISVVFSAQFGDGNAVTQGDHSLGVGSTLPAEFGKDVCGAYAYAFLEGSADVRKTFPSLNAKLLELGIEKEPWSLWKNGHSEHMRGRLQAADVKELMAIHPNTHMTSGHFWHTPTKAMASKVENNIRTDPVAKYRVQLTEHPNFQELFVLPHSMSEWLREEGQKLTSKAIASAVDKTELAMLKLECKHRDEVASVCGEKDAEIRTLRVEIAAKEAENRKLADDKHKVAHVAARMLCPKKKLLDLDAMFK